jgi:hypothetical protein
VSTSPKIQSTKLAPVAPWLPRASTRRMAFRAFTEHVVAATCRRPYQRMKTAANVSAAISGGITFRGRAV